ncbi:MAG: hypothetical protein ACRDU8_04000 [Egibacteraceae bacterium]
MATPLPQRLRIKPGHRLRLLEPPAGFDATLGPLPDDVEVLAAGPAEVVVAFFRSQADV